MAESSDNAGSWPGLVSQINSTFNLLRDLFGYALPGGVFLAIGVLSGRYSLSDLDNLLSPYHPPAWAFVALVFGACYIVGDILAAIAYMPNSVLKWIAWEAGKLRDVVRDWEGLKNWPKLRGVIRFLGNRPALWLGTWLEQNPTEVSAELLRIRSTRKELFLMPDRRETLTILAGSTSAALLGGWYVFVHKQWDAGTICFWAGIIVVLQFATGMSHLRRVAAAVRAADSKLAEAEKVVPPTPDFNQPLADFVKATTDLVAAAKKAIPQKTA